MSSNYFKIWVRHPRVQPAKRMDINTFKCTIVTHSNRQHQRGKTGTLRFFLTKFPWSETLHPPLQIQIPGALLPRSPELGTLNWRGWFQWGNELAMHQMIRNMRVQIFVCGLSQRMSQRPRLNVILSVAVWLVYSDYRIHLTTVNWEITCCAHFKNCRINRRTRHFDNFSW